MPLAPNITQNQPVTSNGAKKPPAQAPVGLAPPPQLPLHPPNHDLLKLGITASIPDINERVQEITQGHQKLFGHKPQPGLVFDVIRGWASGAVQDVNHLFDIPTSKQDALARKLAATPIAPDPKVVAKQQLEAAIRKQAGLPSAGTYAGGAIPKPQQLGLATGKELKEGWGLLGKGVGEILDSLVAFFPGTYYLGKSAALDFRDYNYQLERSIGIPKKYTVAGSVPDSELHGGRVKTLGKQMGIQVAHDFTTKDNWGYALMDAWAVFTAGAGTGARIGSAFGRAGEFEARAGALSQIRAGLTEDDLAKFKPSKAPRVEKALQAFEGFRKPEVHPGFELGYGAYTEHVPAFQNAALRLIQGWYLGKAQDRLVGRQIARDVDGDINGFLNEGKNSRAYDALFSTENILHRTRINRNNIEYAISQAPLVEMDRLTNWQARARDAFALIKADRQFSTHLSTFGPQEQIAIDKALQLIMTDTANPIGTWRSFHERSIADLEQQQKEFNAHTKESAQALRDQLNFHRQNERDLKEQANELEAGQLKQMSREELEQLPIHFGTSRAQAPFKAPETPALREQARSLLHGFEEPINLRERKDGTLALDGERAHELLNAARIAGVEDIPVRITTVGAKEIKTLRLQAKKEAGLARKLKAPTATAEKVMGMSKKARAERSAEFAYSITSHRAHLEAIEQAEKLLTDPPPRFKAVVDRAYEISREQERMKEIVYGFDPVIGEQHLAEIVALLNGEKLKPLLDAEGNPIENRLGRVVEGPVPDEVLRKNVREATANVKKERRKLETIQLRMAKPTSTGKAAGDRPVLRQNLVDQQAAVASAEDDLRAALHAHETQGSKVVPLERQITGAERRVRVYHGSQGNFKELKAEATRVSQYGKGVYLTTDPKVADMYANPATLEPRPAGYDEEGRAYTASNVRIHSIDENSLFDTRSQDWNGYVVPVRNKLERVIPESVRAILNDPKEKAFDLWRGGTDGQHLIEGLTIAFNSAIHDGSLKAAGEGSDLANEAFAKIGFTGYNTSRHERFIFDPKDIQPGMKSKAQENIENAREGRGSAYSGQFERETERKPPRSYRARQRISRLGLAPPPDETTAMVRMSGKALEVGDFRWDTSQLLAEELKNLWRGAFAQVHYNDLWNIGVKEKISEYHKPIRDIKSAPAKLQKVVAALERHLVEPNAAKMLDEANLQALRDHLYPDPATVDTSDPHVRWVDERMVMSRFAGEHLDFWRNLDNAMTKGTKWINEPWRVLVIFGSPAYILNAGGAAVTLAVEHGFASVDWLGRSWGSNKIWSPEVTRMLDQLAGSTHAAAITTEKATTTFGKGVQGFYKGWQKITDRSFRRAAVIGELYKRGLIHDGMSADEVLKVLQAGTQPMLNKLARGTGEGPELDPAIGRQVIEAAQVGRKQMLDFDKMSWPERASLRHIFFVYSFLRAGSIWSLRFMGEHPVQWAVTAQAGQQRKDEIKELVGKAPSWFYQGGYTPFDRNEVFNPIQFNMPAVLSQVAYSAQSLFNDSPYADLGDTFGAAGLVATDLARGTTTSGQNLPGGHGRLFGSILDLMEKTPPGYAIAREQKLNKQRNTSFPPPPVSISETSPLEGAARRERGLVKLSSFELDGFWNNWGRLIGRTAVPIETNKLALQARYWRDVKKNDPEAYVQHQYELAKEVALRQAGVLGMKSVPADVQNALSLVAAREMFIESWSRKQGIPNPGDRQQAVLTVAFLKKEGIINDKKANEYKSLINEAHGNSAWRASWLKMLHENGGQAWADWTAKVNTVNYFNTDRFGSAVANLKEAGVGDYAQAATAPRETKWAYGRQYADYVDQRNALQDEARAAKDSFSHREILEQIRQLDDKASQEVAVNGVTFPAMRAAQFGKLNPDQRSTWIRSRALAPWWTQDSFSREILTGKVPDPAIEEGYAKLAQWMDEAHARLAVGEHLPSNTRSYYAQILADRAAKAGNTSFRDDLVYAGILPKQDGTRTLQAERLQNSIPVQGSLYRAQWEYMLGFVSYTFKKAISDGWTTSTDKPNYGGIADLWRSYYVPQKLEPWLQTQSAGFRQEVNTYVAEHPHFLNNLIKR